MLLRLEQTATPPAEIGAALIRAAEQARAKHPHRSVTINNMLIPLSDREQLASIEPTLDLLARVHPGRIFVLFPTSGAEITADVGLRLSVLSKEDAVSSQVIRLGFDPSSIAALTSVLRANFQPGVKTELFLLDRSLDRALADLLLLLSEVLIFDSEELEKTHGLMGHLVRESALHRLEFVDLQWIELGSWREQVKYAFGRPIVQSRVGQLSRLVVTVSTNGPTPFTSCALLMAGWLVNRLRLSVQSFGRSGFTAVDPERRSVEVAIERDDQPGISGLRRIEFIFGSAEESIVIRGADSMVETFVRVGEPVHSTAPLERLTAAGQLEHYYAVGESVSNYQEALITAIDLDELQKGF